MGHGGRVPGELLGKENRRPVTMKVRERDKEVRKQMEKQGIGQEEGVVFSKNLDMKVLL